MKLHRARTLASRPQAKPAYEGNEPAVRIRGRWFTSDIEAARRHMATLAGPAEIVTVEVPDDVVDAYRVATTPETACGLSPIAFSTDPRCDHVLPMFRVLDAVVAESSAGRIRDVIDVREAEIVDLTGAFGRRLPLAA